MKKIQLYIPENLYQEITTIASQDQLSIPVFIRNFLIKTMEEKKGRGIETLKKFSQYNLDGGNLSTNIAGGIL